MDLITDEVSTVGTLNVGHIVQLTEAQSPPRRWIWQAEPLVEDVVTFGTVSDPRDARIAQLEAALREIRARVEAHRPFTVQDVLIMRAVNDVLMPEPEASMSITIEELEA